MTRGRRIAFFTSTEDAALTEDDRLALPFLQARGITVVPLVWDAWHGEVDGLDGFVFRSCWDSHRKPRAFDALCQRLEQARAPVWNPPSVVRWNVHKGYLLELAARGIRVPRTHLIRAGSSLSDLGGFLALLGEGMAVVKPAVSLSGHDTSFFSTTDIEGIARAVRALTSTRDVLVQECVDEIKSGELSFVFYGGEFSHAIRKLPGAGELRVQVEYGGTRQRLTPSGETIAEARRIAEAAPTPLLYARIDVVERHGELILMEYEAIDPMLFLGWSDGAPERWADALATAFR